MTVAPAFTLRRSQCPLVIETHMKQMHSASISVLVLALSWYTPDSNDENDETTDDLVPTILDKDHIYNLKQKRKRSKMFFCEDNTEISEDLHTKFLMCLLKTRVVNCENLSIYKEVKK